MPGMDRLEATRRIIKMRPPGKCPRIVAMTAKAYPGDRERCIAAGMDDYIGTPILPAAVQALIERCAGPGEALLADAADSQLIDDAVLREPPRLDEPDSPSMLRGLLGDFLGEMPATVGA